MNIWEIERQKIKIRKKDSRPHMILPWHCNYNTKLPVSALQVRRTLLGFPTSTYYEIKCRGEFSLITAAEVSCQQGYHDPVNTLLFVFSPTYQMVPSLKQISLCVFTYLQLNNQTQYTWRVKSQMSDHTGQVSDLDVFFQIVHIVL